MTSVGRNWCRWEKNIIFTLKETGRNGVQKINLATYWYKRHNFVNLLGAIRIHKRQEISRLTEEFLAFQRLCSKQYAT
jgi:hypothetical protein